MTKYAYFFIFIAFSVSVYGQQNTSSQYGSSSGSYDFVSDVSTLSPEDYLEMRLPALDFLLDQARHSPVVEYFDLIQQADEGAVKTQKRAWTNYIKLNSGYQYGKIHTNLFDENNDLSFRPDWMYSKREQSFWNVGVSLTLPFGEVIDRKNRIKQQKLRAQATMQERERWYEEQCLKIVEAYTEAVECLATIKPLAETVAVSSGQLEVSRMEFVHGKINAQEYSHQQSIHTVSITNYEKARARLNNSILRLELLSRTKIINR